MRLITITILLAAAALGFSQGSSAQFGTGSPTTVTPHVDGPAPARDLTGVWTRISPEGTFRSGSTWTPEPPILTEWGQTLFEQAKNSNAGAFALGETNDPVLTRCYPPGYRVSISIHIPSKSFTQKKRPFYSMSTTTLFDAFIRTGARAQRTP